MLMYCPKCGAPLRSVTNGWKCTNICCSCCLDAYGNIIDDPPVFINYWNCIYEIDENPIKVRQWL